MKQCPLCKAELRILRSYSRPSSDGGTERVIERICPNKQKCANAKANTVVSEDIVKN